MSKKYKVILISGGFDPVHKGHIQCIQNAREFADEVWIGLNNDSWLRNKKGKEFMPFNERKIVLENLKLVDEVCSFQDDDIGSCIHGLNDIKKKYPKDDIIFCNGGDRTQSNIPEMSLKDIVFEFEIGGSNKLNSSSEILKNWNYQKEKRIIFSPFYLYCV